MQSLPNGVHTTIDAHGTGWVNKAQGEVLSRHDTKRNAIEEGARLALRHATTHTIHRDDGSEISTHSYARAVL